MTVRLVSDSPVGDIRNPFRGVPGTTKVEIAARENDNRAATGGEVNRGTPPPDRPPIPRHVRRKTTMTSTRIAKAAAVLAVSLGALLLSPAAAAAASATDTAAVSTVTTAGAVTTDSLGWGG
ncbi:hypothetical protein Kpho02_25790 [Kitasatospora phosalacinea]|uniref:Uncharacterized protein n=2 Tax=Kitasatospora phosalacinea TaxID=2065 RepID=A0A9W6V2Q8_9ACTN|nr:hypothetical protein Kpho02_25790 [Kitasatospora phosalacinea]